METYSAYFEYSNPWTDSSRKDYEWWTRIMPALVERCDSFRLECKKKDIAGSRSCARMGAQDRAIVQLKGNVEIWEGIIDQRFFEEFINDAFDARNRLKWSSVLLRASGKTLLAFTKNGAEIGLHGIDMDELESLAAALHGHNFSFFYWEEAKNGQVVHFQPIYGGESELSDVFLANLINRNTE